MKKLLTLIFVCAIFFGCSASQSGPSLEPSLIPPLPNFKHRESKVGVIEQSEFSCKDAPTKVVGQVIFFMGQVAGSELMEAYSLWVFYSNDSILIKFDIISEQPVEVWYDYGNDFEPENYFTDYTKTPDYPDMCKSLETLRK